jgi:Cu2+-exporting ATPase
MEQYNVTGMSCAACQARVEKAVSKVPGVDSCSVSLLTNSMGVEGSADPSAIIKAVEDAGYGASKRGGAVQAQSADGDEMKVRAAMERLSEEEKALEDTTTPKLKKRLISSIGFLLVLMYFSMGHNMAGFPLPEFFENDPLAIALVEMFLAAIVMIINKKFFTSGFSSLIHGGPNMDTLVAMGSMTSFLWSVFILFKMTADQTAGRSAEVMSDLHGLYFETAAMIVTLITVGKMLESMSKGRTTDALKGLMKLAPKTAVVVRDGEEVEVGIENVRTGDIFAVRPGESVPVDGVIVDGMTSIDESSLTGESIPVDKAEGDTVSAATINKSGYFRARATRIGEDTTLSQIIKMVSDAAATKAPIAKTADKVSGVFVPAVLIAAAAVTVIWLIAGASIGYALARGIAVLVISCPCALGLATPVAIMVGNGMGAKNGILFKTAASLESTGKVSVIALDKTGTITKGEPSVTDVVPAEGISRETLLSAADALESKSEHPLAKAVSAYFDEKREEYGLRSVETEDFEVVPGKGLRAAASADALGLAAQDGEDTAALYGGNLAYISEIVDVDDAMKEEAERLAGKGRTPMLFAADGKLLGIIAVADTIKEDSRQAVQELKNQGLHVVMLTGDNQRTAEAIGAEAGVDEVIAGVLPDGKESVIRKLKKKGSVAMVGDGINDAPALTRADIGIAIGAGADVAIDAADVVLMNSKLTDVSAAIRLSRATLRNIHENLFWAFFYNVLLIPLAAGAYVNVMHGWSMNPMWGAAAMSLSSFCVCMNALRLNLFKVHDATKDRPLKSRNNKTSDEEEDEEMTKTINIEGMMCEHCEATVKKALESLDGVSAAEVSHEKGTAVVEMDADVADDVLKKAVEDKDYKVVSIA